MKKFYKTFTLLIVLGVLVAFAGMAFAKEKGAAVLGKKTDVIAMKKADRADAVSWAKKDIAFGIVFAEKGHISVALKKEADDYKKVFASMNVETGMKTDRVIVAVTRPDGSGAKKERDGDRSKSVDTAAEAVLAYTTDLADSSCMIVAHTVDITGKSKGGAAFAATFVPMTKIVV